MTELAYALVAGTDGVARRTALTYRRARADQREAHREATERARGWTAMTARAAASFLIHFRKQAALKLIEEVPDAN